MNIWTFTVEYAQVPSVHYSDDYEEIGIVMLGSVPIFESTPLNFHYKDEDREREVMNQFARALEKALHPGPHLIR